MKPLTHPFHTPSTPPAVYANRRTWLGKPLRNRQHLVDCWPVLVACVDCRLRSTCSFEHGCDERGGAPSVLKVSFQVDAQRRDRLAAKPVQCYCRER